MYLLFEHAALQMEIEELSSLLAEAIWPPASSCLPRDLRPVGFLDCWVHISI